MRWVLLYLFAGQVALGAKDTSGWPMFRRSPRHDACSPARGPVTNTTKWVFQADGPVYSSPALSVEGLLFFGTYAKPHGTLYALNASTSVVAWKFEAGGPIGSTPCYIAETDLVVFGADDGSIYAVDGTTGKQVWRFRHDVLAHFGIASSAVFIPSSANASASATAGTGTIFIGTSDRTGQILALVVSGRSAPTLRWSRATGGGAVGAGVPGACAVYDGTVFVGANDGNVYALNAADGTTKWSAATQGIVYSSPALSLDGARVFVGSNDGTAYALNSADGTVLWTVPTDGWVDSSPAVDDAAGLVFFGTSNGNGLQNYAALIAVNASTGEVRWSDVLASADGLYDPVVAGAIVYAGSVFDNLKTGAAGGHVHAWDKLSGKRLWQVATNGHVGTAAALGAHADLFIGDQGGQLFRLQ